MSCPDYLLPNEGERSNSGERRRSRRVITTVIATVLGCMALAVPAPVAGASAIGPLVPDVAIVPFAGDVFTVGSNGSLIDVDPRNTPASAPLFSLEGSPLTENGAPLTWGQYSSATAKSVAVSITRRGIEHTDIGIVMSGLIPNGVYSLFYRTFSPDSNNPLCPDVEPSLALTSAFPRLQKPDPDSFVANGSGGAFFLARVAAPLLDATSLQISVIYHFNGQVYGPVANEAESFGPVSALGGLCRSSYGIDAMRQFLIIQK